MYFACMWKKVLALLSIPVLLFFLFWMLRTIWALVVAGPEGMDAWAIYVIVVTIIVLFAWLLFFWGRWIWRVLFRRKPSKELHWPE